VNDTQGTKNIAVLLAQRLWRAIAWPSQQLWRALAALGRLFNRLPPIAGITNWLDERTLLTRMAIARHVGVARSAWVEARREESLKVPAGKEIEFLPAALEVQEAPPSPAGRTTAWLIIGIFAAALVWATFGRIDIIAVAQGKIVPGDRSKVIQPLEAGIIKEIFVHDGQRVKRGDPLIEIDTNAGSDRERLAKDYLAAQIELARLKALMAGESSFEPPRGADPASVQVQQKRLREQQAEWQALESQAETYRKLRARKFVSEVQYLDFERNRADKVQGYAAARTDAENRVNSLAQDLAKASTRASQQHLSTPIDGVVQQLAVHTVGGVVTPAQQLLVIAPEEGHLEIEAWLENKDIGFVNEQQETEIKIESFPFTRYGTIDGQVTSLSRDAVPVDKVGLVYAARVSMARSTIEVENGREVRLSPGMNVTVEIKTGSRRVIEYFLSPLIQGVKETAHER
jgi:hemolysin D